MLSSCPLLMASTICCCAAMTLGGCSVRSPSKNRVPTKSTLMPSWWKSGRPEQQGVKLAAYYDGSSTPGPGNRVYIERARTGTARRLGEISDEAEGNMPAGPAGAGWPLREPTLKFAFNLLALRWSLECINLELQASGFKACLSLSY